ncbi:MAG: PIN domain protein [Acidobacteriota bacterium]|jgi:predicted nucleic acid-binding protein|nr:PIN domain protein [Acidobacteriota bacterium]
MKPLLLYLDNCCFNRPYDDQGQLSVRLETEAVLAIRDAVQRGAADIVWSYMLETENDDNPFIQRREAIGKWRTFAKVHVDGETEGIANALAKFESNGVKPKDAVHIACALAAQANYFITTDRKLLRRNVKEIQIISPIELVRILEKGGGDD